MCLWRILPHLQFLSLSAHCLCSPWCLCSLASSTFLQWDPFILAKQNCYFSQKVRAQIVNGKDQLHNCMCYYDFKKLFSIHNLIKMVEHNDTAIKTALTSTPLLQMIGLLLSLINSYFLMWHQYSLPYKERIDILAIKIWTVHTFECMLFMLVLTFIYLSAWFKLNMNCTKRNDIEVLNEFGKK